jgi:quercetin dioxygenase-like cupin family protein
MSEITVVPLSTVAERPLPNGSWSKVALNRDSVSGIVSSLGYSIFTPGTVLTMVSHETEEVAIALSGRGELLTDSGAVPFGALEAVHIPAGVWHAVSNTGTEDLIMVFGFPHPDFPPTQRRDG